jgi:P-type Cu2+ transporter
MGAKPKEQSTAVLDVRGLNWASEKAVVEAVLGRRPGVLDVEANSVAQTATVTYDPRVTSLVELRRWVIECGYHCAGQSVPAHVCDPMVEPDPPDPPADGHAGHGRHGGPAAATMPVPPATAEPAGPAGPAAHAGHAPRPRMRVTPHRRGRRCARRRR